MKLNKDSWNYRVSTWFGHSARRAPLTKGEYLINLVSGYGILSVFSLAVILWLCGAAEVLIPGLDLWEDASGWEVFTFIIFSLGSIGIGLGICEHWDSIRNYIEDEWLDESIEYEDTTTHSDIQETSE